MNEIGEKYLPIGTIVVLKNATKRIMITGFASMSPETGDTIYDYSGCPYSAYWCDTKAFCGSRRSTDSWRANAFLRFLSLASGVLSAGSFPGPAQRCLCQ